MTQAYTGSKVGWGELEEWFFGSVCIHVTIRTNLLLLSLPFETQIVFVIS